MVVLSKDQTVINTFLNNFNIVIHLFYFFYTYEKGSLYTIGIVIFYIY